MDNQLWAGQKKGCRLHSMQFHCRLCAKGECIFLLKERQQMFDFYKSNKVKNLNLLYLFLLLPGLLLLVSVFLPWFNFTSPSFNREHYSVNALGWKNSSVTIPGVNYKSVLLAAFVGIVSGILLITMSILSLRSNTKRLALSSISLGFLILIGLLWAMTDALDVFDRILFADNQGNVLNISVDTEIGFSTMVFSGVLIVIGNLILLIVKPYLKRVN